jgi:hypothetical protein
MYDGRMKRILDRWSRAIGAGAWRRDAMRCVAKLEMQGVVFGSSPL